MSVREQILRRVVRRSRQGRCGDLPRAVGFISGTSRTGGIEQTIVLGARGPCRVHLILWGDAS